MLYYEAIDSPTLALLRSLMEAPEFRQLNLAGGTSLALQIGHRKSIDIDLFGTFEMDDYQFSTTLKQFESVIQLYNSKNICLSPVSEKGIFLKNTSFGKSFCSMKIMMFVRDCSLTSLVQFYLFEIQ